MGDDKAHFVHMGGEKNLFAPGLPPLFVDDKVAHVVHLVPVAVALYPADEVVPDLVLTAGDPPQLGKFFHLFQQFHLTSPPGQIPP